MDSYSPERIASLVSLETGFAFWAKVKVDRGEQCIDLHPAGLPEANTFKIRVLIGWRHFEVLFKPGTFSSSLLEAMRDSGREGRELFDSIIRTCEAEGAAVKLKLRGRKFEVGDASIWDSDWENVTFRLRVSLAELGYQSEGFSESTLVQWTCRLAAAVLALMPLAVEDIEVEGESGFPEGASKTIEVNRYERDPRNRAAAIAIHGCKCFGCGLQMSDLYGELAEGFIEVHHLKPLSTLGGEYCVDPTIDLVPLCPNCHSIVHKKKPPLSMSELRKILKKANLGAMSRSSGNNQSGTRGYD